MIPSFRRQFEQRTDNSNSSSEGQQHFNPAFDNANRISSKVNLDRIADGLSGTDIPVETAHGAQLVEGPYVAETVPVHLEEDYVVVEM